MHSGEQNFIHKGTLGGMATPLFGDGDDTTASGASGRDALEAAVSQVLPSVETPNGTEKREKEEAVELEGSLAGIGEAGPMVHLPSDAVDDAPAAEKKEGRAVEAIAETELAADVGLTRQKLGQLRVEHELLEGMDWKKKGKAVVYLPAGVLRVRSLLVRPSVWVALQTPWCRCAPSIAIATR